MNFKTRMRIVIAVFLAMTVFFQPVAHAGLDDFLKDVEEAVTKAGEIGEQIRDAAPKVQQFMEQFDKYSGQAGKQTRFLDPEMDKDYERLRNREIDRKRKAFQDAKKAYRDTPLYRFFTRSQREKEMLAAEDEYMRERMRWEKEKYLFKKKSADETSGWTFWRKGDRKKQADNQLSSYINSVISWEEEKLKRARMEYEDTPGIFFWKKSAKKKAMEEQKEYLETKRSQMSNLFIGQEGLPSSPYDDYINMAASRYGVPAALIKAVCIAESNMNPRAKSPKGAKGLMQLMPGTFDDMGGGDPYDPKTNIMAGTRYLAMMLQQQNGNVQLALAAYNAGPGKVKRYKGIPPYEETQKYVKKVSDLYEDLSMNNYGKDWSPQNYRARMSKDLCGSAGALNGMAMGMAAGPGCGPIAGTTIKTGATLGEKISTGFAKVAEWIAEKFVALKNVFTGGSKPEKIGRDTSDDM